MHDFKRVDLTATKNDIRNINCADLLHSLNDIESMWSIFRASLKYTIYRHCPLKIPNCSCSQCMPLSLV